MDHVTGIITTVAGTGVLGDSGDGGQATAAEICLPTGIAVDANGNLYFSESSGYCEFDARVRKVNLATGIITTIAGTGIWGDSGDGGPATAAQLARPMGLALDSAGDLFIADRDDQCVRKVDLATGIITTPLGIGTSDDGAVLSGPEYVALDAAGDLFVSLPEDDHIYEASATGAVTIIAGTEARAIAATAARRPQPRSEILWASASIPPGTWFSPTLGITASVRSTSPPA